MTNNQRIHEHLEKDPLMAFSVYTDTQAKIVKKVGVDVIHSLDEAATDEPNKYTFVPMQLEGMSIDAAYGWFWLWVVSAYEVVRTMCQAEQCFSDHVVSQLKELKRKLRVIRVPLVKQELPGKKGFQLPQSPQFTRRAGRRPTTFLGSRMKNFQYGVWSLNLKK